VTKWIADALNVRLQEVLPREEWARIVVDDYRAAGPRHFGDANRRTSHLMGHARRHYGPLKLQKTELERAVAALPS
jgi:hypothetical protein